MMSPGKATITDEDLRQALYAELCEVARAGGACPTTDGLSTRHHVGGDRMRRALRALEDAGMIVVTGSSNSRRVRITATGEETRATRWRPDAPAKTAADLYAILCAAADAGEQCPPVAVLTERLRVNRDALQRTFVALCEAGKIAYARTFKCRIVQIIETGKWTTNEGISVAYSTSSRERPFVAPAEFLRDMRYHQDPRCRPCA